MFGQQFQQLPYEQLSPQFEKLANLTVNTLRNTQSYRSPVGLSYNFSFPQPIDLSIDNHIPCSNVEKLKGIVASYLQSCFVQNIDSSTVFIDQSIFCFQASEILQLESQRGLEDMIKTNPLLQISHKQLLIQNIEEFEEFKAYLLQIYDVFGVQISQQLVLIAAQLIYPRLESFRNVIAAPDTGILPKIEAFRGYEQSQQFFKDSWSAYETVDQQQVEKIARENTSIQAMNVYFSQKMRFLTLRATNSELREGVNVADKFAALIEAFSANLFFTLAGMAHQDQSQNNRQYGQELDFLVKKVKSDF